MLIKMLYSCLNNFNVIDTEFGTPFSFRLTFVEKVEKTEKHACAGLALEKCITLFITLGILFCEVMNEES